MPLIVGKVHVDCCGGVCPLEFVGVWSHRVVFGGRLVVCLLLRCRYGELWVGLSVVSVLRSGVPIVTVPCCGCSSMRVLILGPGAVPMGTRVVVCRLVCTVFWPLRGAARAWVGVSLAWLAEMGRVCRGLVRGCCVGAKD